jgi:hypothetical protein
MADETPTPKDNPQRGATLEGGTYEVIRHRLDVQAAELRDRLSRLNGARQEVFGAIPTALLATERITTANNCVPRDLVSIGRNRFLFGYNVYIGLRSETQIADVFAAYVWENQTFTEIPLDLIGDSDFESDFKELYKYYRQTVFAKFSIIGPHLFMVFRIGQDVADIKTFKWLMRDGALSYQGNRSDHEFRFPPQHEFEWIRTHRDLHRAGRHPHISIEDRVFVETVGGDLTIKVEDNTESGEGIHAEPVEHADQTLDDAEVFYASLGNLVLLKIRPYQEKAFRYFVFNAKLKEVRRIDAIEDSCVLLPNHQGIIFSNGYYLQLGEFKQFPTQLTEMRFERRVQAPNGEDYLYVFYNRRSGAYVLMSYNLIEQRVEAPLVCNGLSLFESGEAALFKGHEEPQRHHVVQIWQTPYRDANLPLEEKTDSYLYKIGNPAIVRCMSECHEILSLLRRDDAYADLYVDVVKATGDVIDSYFWIDRPETFQIKATLDAIRAAATAAIDEFDKVVRLKRDTAAAVQRVAQRARERMETIRHAPFAAIGEFVAELAALRSVRGELIAVKERRYVDLERVEGLEQEIVNETEQLSNRCVEFLLRPEALAPYEQAVESHETAVDSLAKVTEARQLGEAIDGTGSELELLIEIVGNLKIEDSTQTTRIIDQISGIYAPLNRIKAALRRKRLELQQVEGGAQFNAQARLLDQSAVNYLELCDTPEKCEEYLTRMMVQIEELEGRFADFEEYIVELAGKRSELYTAFENRKVALVEARNQRANSLMTAADRILKGIEHRAATFTALSDLEGYFASDLMVERVRDLIRQLTELQDSVKAGDLQTRLKTVHEDAVRQLRDRQDLFLDGGQAIQFGRHKFAVNTLNLELTTVLREGRMDYHLAGTRFFQPITDEAFLATRPVWDQETVSENREVYRAEYLAWQILKALDSGSTDLTAAQLAGLDDDGLLAWVQRFMAPRYSEAYVKGVHDPDTARILRALLRIHTTIGLLRFAPRARACAAVFWHLRRTEEPVLPAKLDAIGVSRQLFPDQAIPDHYAAELGALITPFLDRTGLFPVAVAADAGEYLARELTAGSAFVISSEAARIYQGFAAHLRQHHFLRKFQAARQAVESDPRSAYQVIRDWIGGYLAVAGEGLDAEYVDEAAAILFRDASGPHASGCGPHADITTIAEVGPMAGSHPVIHEERYTLRYNAFVEKMRRYEREIVPRFEEYQALKTRLTDEMRRRLRLEEFQPRVLTSFVRNQLIDSVYLPLVGDNLAKQIGVVGAQTRTDRSGLLLVISPPGYGKTTLMEYIANRLGIIFMKINGPAIGHQVTSLDPAEARNASAREEIEKLNLSLEMGDNVMIYLDDIQHCHPELLQKFISLCDAQRKIEGVFQGRPRTYDLRGRKVAVVMAGNPYTESGEKFQIPDMLANRADTYNLGDILGGAEAAFKASYLENAVTSNPVLNPLAGRSQSDVRAIIRIAETGSREGVELEGHYAAEELGEMVAVMKKLIRIREVLLRVNQEYIRSAAQADAYRTEPPFRLQGSYRNMNRLAERVLPIMNDEEITALILDHYQNEAQTLTTGAEANLLKFRELMGLLSETEAQRWADIQRTFQRNLLFENVDRSDPVGQVVAQLGTFTEGLHEIKSVLAAGLNRPQEVAAVDPADTIGALVDQVKGKLAVFAQHLEAIRNVLADGLRQRGPSERAPAEPGAAAQVLTQLNVALDGIRTQLAEAVRQQRQQATFRLIDPTSPADYQITDVSRQTLTKIWALIEEDRKGSESGADQSDTTDSSDR